LIYRHVVAAGVDLVSNDRSLSWVPDTDTLPNPERALNLVVIFASLTPDERRSLAVMKQKTIDKGEVLLEPGVVLQSLFIIGMGVLSLTQVVARSEIELMRLGPGDHFGEIGLLTGAPSVARISALIPTTVYEVTKDDLAPILEARATVAQELGRGLARRPAAGRLITSPRDGRGRAAQSCRQLVRGPAAQACSILRMSRDQRRSARGISQRLRSHDGRNSRSCSASG
jgi:CRP-like cAMP-binding protein